MHGFANWLESVGDVEDNLFNAISNEQVSQADFGKMIYDWENAADPTLAGVKLQRNQYGKGGSTNFLSGQWTPSLAAVAGNRMEEYGYSNIGLIIQPFTYNYLRTERLKVFDGIGIDNGMFTKAGQQNFSWDKYEKMVKIALAQEKRGVLAKLHFFTIPDEPFNWLKTMEKFKESRAVVQKLRGLGAPVAVVTQNGANINNVPWDDIDVIFIGGNDNYKVGPESEAITKEAQKRGKGVHMGRVNGLKRLNTASEWGVDTADGTYLMHELGKSLHDIERLNPRRPNENQQDYAERLRRILHDEHDQKDLEPGNKVRHYSEPMIVNNFVSSVLDTQDNSNILRRYNAIANMVQQAGRPVSKAAIQQVDRYLPQIPQSEQDEDVVLFDDKGYVKMTTYGKPARNPDVFNQVNERLPFRSMPEGIPFDKDDPKVYTSYINKYIMRMRDMGVMPR